MPDSASRNPEALPDISGGGIKDQLCELKEETILSRSADEISASELVGEQAELYMKRSDIEDIFLSRKDSEIGLLISSFEVYKNQQWAAKVLKALALKEPSVAILNAEIWGSTSIVSDQGFMIQLAESKPQLFLPSLSNFNDSGNPEVVFAAALAAAKKIGSPDRVKTIIENSGVVLTEGQKNELYAKEIAAVEPTIPPAELAPIPPEVIPAPSPAAPQASVPVGEPEAPPAAPQEIPDTLNLAALFNNFEKYKAAPNLIAFLNAAVDRGTENVYIRVADNFEKIEEAVGHDAAYNLLVKIMKDSAESVGYSWVPIKYFKLHKDSDVLRAAIKRTQGAQPGKLIELYEYYKDVAEIDPKKIFSDAISQLAKSRSGKADLIRLYPVYSKYIDGAEADKVFETAVKDLNQEDKMLLADIVGDYEKLQKGTTEYTVGVGQKTKILHLIGESSEALAALVPAESRSTAEVPASPGEQVGDKPPVAATQAQTPVAEQPAPDTSEPVVVEPAPAPAPVPAPAPAPAPTPAPAPIVTPERIVKKVNSVWRETVGIRDKNQEARADYYEKYAKSKLGAVPEDVLNNPAKYGLKTFEELAKVEPKEWTVKQGDAVWKYLNQYFKDSPSRGKEVALSLYYLGQQDVNVDLIKVGEKVEISDGQLIIKGVDGYERVSGYLRKEKAPAASKVGPQEGVFGFARRAAQEAQDKAKATPPPAQEGTPLPDEPDNSVQEGTPLPDEPDNSVQEGTPLP